MDLLDLMNAVCKGYVIWYECSTESICQSMAHTYLLVYCSFCLEEG